MPFELINVERTRTVRSETEVVVSTHSNDSICIFFPKSILEKMNWKPYQYFDVLEGSGGDVGHIAVQPTQKGGVKLCPRPTGDGFLRVRRRALKHHFCAEGKIQGTPCATQAFGGRVVFIVPNWITPK